MNNDKIDLDLEQLDQLAREFWQDDLAKFFVKQKEPTYTEYRMFQAGYQQALFEARLNLEQLKAERQSNSVLKATLKQTRELLKDTLAFIEATEKLNESN